ncbi:MAG TPA: lactate utilization protein B [Deltaproteobacteria bacterium]|nr:lactate utilization protein B [Deltaproteobacteria bacterium]
MHSRVDKFVETARRELKVELSQAFLLMLSLGAPIMRQIGLSSFPDPAAAEAYSRAVRAEAVDRLPELLEEFERNATARGVQVIWARDAAEANSAILDIAQRRGIRYVTKGKSLVTEEIGLNEHLVEGGVEVFETDLGEVITQLLSLPPFHLVGPALNVPPEEISAVFLKKGIISEPTTVPVELGKAARAYLREKFRHLDMGIVGVNVAVAETGTFINVENEGNIRLTKSSPKTLVAVMSLEKVVPTMADALHLVRMVCRNCTGQKLSSYVSMDTGPKKTGEIDGPEEVFIVIVDNGRSEIYRDPQARQILRCIRCGACANVCPVYAKIGGYPYGFAYTGPMGQVMNPLLLGIEACSDLYRACTLCGACSKICPAGVDHPSLILEYRAREIRLKNGGSADFRSRAGKALASLLSMVMGSSLLWRLGVKCARPVLNRFARGGYISGIPTGPQAWFGCRDLRAMPARTFHEQWQDLQAGSGREAS